MRREDNDYHPEDSDGTWDYDSEPDMDDYDDFDEWDKDWDDWEYEQRQNHS